MMASFCSASEMYLLPGGFALASSQHQAMLQSQHSPDGVCDINAASHMRAAEPVHNETLGAIMDCSFQDNKGPMETLAYSSLNWERSGQCLGSNRLGLVKGNLSVPELTNEQI